MVHNILQNPSFHLQNFLCSLSVRLIGDPPPSIASTTEKASGEFLRTKALKTWLSMILDIFVSHDISCPTPLPLANSSPCGLDLLYQIIEQSPNPYSFRTYLLFRRPDCLDILSESAQHTRRSFVYQHAGGMCLVITILLIMQTLPG